MPDIAALVRELGGMAQKQQLVRLGAHDLELTDAVRDGSVTRVRNGWYSTMEEVDPRLRAVRVGGRLTGLALIHALDGWVLTRPPLHVSLAANAARMRTASNRRRRFDVRRRRGVVLHWDGFSVLEHGDATSVALLDALHRVVVDETLETAVAALDWALHSGAIDTIDFERLIGRLPQSRRWIAEWVDAACESLPESLARTRLRLRGFAVVSQVPLGDTERIDLLIDDIAAMEVDGREWHQDRFEQDRAKDVRITIAGKHALRPSARMVFDGWSEVIRAVEVALAARGSPPRQPMRMPRNARLEARAFSRRR